MALMAKAPAKIRWAIYLIRNRLASLCHKSPQLSSERFSRDAVNGVEKKLR
jgi:hypothetical protein